MRTWSLSLFLMLLTGLAHATTMGEADAWHLLSRTGFAPNPDELASYASLSRTAAVNRLLARTSRQAVTAVASDLADYTPPPEHFKDLSPDEKKTVSSTASSAQLGIASVVGRRDDRYS